LFTGGRIAGEVAAARANLSQAQLRLQQSRELAEVDLRNALIQLEAAQAGWQASAGTVEQASHAYQIADLRYREGISTQTELLDSRIQLEQAQASRARAARDLQVAKIRLALLPALPLSQYTSTSVTGATSTLPATGQPQSGGSALPSYQPPPPPPDITGLVTGVPGQ
jgi:outer membrane protein